MATTVNQWLFENIMPQLPKKWMSHYVGKAAHFQVPGPVNQQLIKRFAKFYNIDINEAEKSLGEYKSLGEFFSRKLKDGARPIDGEVVHPCDGLLLESGKVHQELLIQAKGKSFSLDEFVPDNPWFDDFKGGSFFTYYLAPHNYHRVHSPVSGQIKWSTLVPGELWPVNKWSVRSVDDLYAINERVAAGIETPQGKVILVMVGATNVGSMSFKFDPNIKTNSRNKKQNVHRQYDEGRSIEVGEEFGIFHLGSTVVALYDGNWGFNHQDRKKVLMGEKFNQA